MALLPAPDRSTFISKSDPLNFNHRHRFDVGPKCLYDAVYTAFHRLTNSTLLCAGSNLTYRPTLLEDLYNYYACLLVQKLYFKFYKYCI